MATFSVEVLTLQLRDVERAKRFYVDQVGFELDVDYSPTDAFRVVQMTPSGSSCSIQVGKGLTDTFAGLVRDMYLVVTNIDAVRSDLPERGSEAGDTRSMSPRVDREARLSAVIRASVFEDVGAVRAVDLPADAAAKLVSGSTEICASFARVSDESDLRRGFRFLHGGHDGSTGSREYHGLPITPSVPAGLSAPHPVL